MDKGTRLRLELVKYGKKIADKGLVVGPGGNISARDKDIIYLKARGVCLEEAEEDDYIGVDLKTGRVINRNLKPSYEIQMHLGCYLARPDIKAVIHTHPPLATAVASCGERLRPFHPEFVAIMDSDIPTIGYIPPGTKRLADAVSKVIKGHNGLLLANHGTLTVGSNLKEAYLRTLLIEEAARTLIAAGAIGKIKFFTKREVEEISKKSKK